MDHRRNQRFDLRLPFELMASDDRMGSVGETKDVSSCGVRFESTVPIEIGEPIEYYLKFPRIDRKSTRLNSSHPRLSRMPSSA